MINFPLYALREYSSIEVEDGYRIVHTHRSRYVLDYEAQNTGMPFGMRRVALLGEGALPYPLYPLNIRITNLAGIINCKYRNFIDNDGKLFKWTPKKFHRITCHPITHREITTGGKMLVKILGYNTLFRTEPTNLNYAQMVRFRGVDVIYRFSDTMEKTTRRKL